MFIEFIGMEREKVQTETLDDYRFKAFKKGNLRE